MTSMKTSVVISHDNFKYIITSSPNPNNISGYKDLLLFHGVKTVVKLCEEKEYNFEELEKHNIRVLDIPIQDGSTPDKIIMNKWIDIIKNEKDVIAVHCFSGLGRAPLFVCIGLIKINKFEPLDAVEFIRKHITAALNVKQVQYLNDINTNNKCSIM